MRAVWAFSVGWMLAVSGASAVEGIYHGRGSDPGGYRWQLYAKITALSDGRYRTDVQSTNATYASQTNGIGTMRGRTLKVAGSCPLMIRFQGRSARIVEGVGCAFEHGATCTYSGTLRR